VVEAYAPAAEVTAAGGMPIEEADRDQQTDHGEDGQPEAGQVEDDQQHRFILNHLVILAAEPREVAEASA
jgi:hypothetical protein